MAPSKTFNIAGLATSSVIISNPVIRGKFNILMERLHIGGGNIFGMEASIAAYSNGKEWIDKMLEYVNDNMVLVYNYCRERIPLIKPVKAEATYLMWLDCIDLEMDDVSLHKFMIEKAGLGFNDGPTFGIGGNGFQRINVACPRSVVQEALERLEKAMKIIKP
jgi:cystathionine beta-lyase